MKNDQEVRQLTEIRYLIRVRRDNSPGAGVALEIDSVSGGTSCSYSLKYSAEKGEAAQRNEQPIEDA